MTFFRCSFNKSYPTSHEFTALTLDDLNDGGLHGDVSWGDSFTMPAGASVCITVSDDDDELSGDEFCWSDDNAEDRSYQTAAITEGADGPEVGNGGQIHAERYYWVADQTGVEAEDMYLWGYKVECFDDASGGKVLRADDCGPSYAKTWFKGEDGTYDLNLRMFGENNGRGSNFADLRNGGLLDSAFRGTARKELPFAVGLVCQM